MSGTLRTRLGILVLVVLLSFGLLFLSFSPVRPSRFSLPTLSRGSTFASDRDRPSNSKDDTTRPSGTLCPPHAWSAGHWERTKNHADTTVSTPKDILSLYGFQECASQREWHLHLGADREHKYYRMPNLTEWEWVPSEACTGMQPFHAEALVRELVEEGGWLMIGDSITEGHFFTLSCMLYPHVRASYDEMTVWDRAWPQHLYLNPASPLVPHLSFPEGFDIDTTPLVTTRRVDVLYTLSELAEIYNTTSPPLPPSSSPLLNMNQAVWTLSPSYYLRLFTGPLPQAHYKTLLTSTGGHWTLALFSGLEDWSTPDGGHHKIVAFFEQAMHKWGQDVQSAIDAAAKKRGPKRIALARAYLPGHDNCHDPVIEDAGPITEFDPENGKNSWNWHYIPDFNHALERVLGRAGTQSTSEYSLARFPDVHFLGIERPGLLRPDTHVSQDCLHILTGPGVQEGWTHYIWHYISQEIPRMSNRLPNR